MDIIIFSLLAYLLGSVPFGLVLTRLAGYGDIRQIGSGNIGATNVLRTGNKPLALLTLILDGGKGALAVGLTLLSAHFFPAVVTENAFYAAGLFSIIGHCFPVWLRFKGGKGVATTLGMFLAMAPLTGLSACLAWLIMALAFRISSLAALTALLSTPLSALLIYSDTKLALISTFVSALVWYRHKDNIKRLLRGEEPVIGKKKSAPPPEEKE